MAVAVFIGVTGVAVDVAVAVAESVAVAVAVLVGTRVTVAVLVGTSVAVAVLVGGALVAGSVGDGVMQSAYSAVTGPPVPQVTDSTMSNAPIPMDSRSHPR